MLNKVFIEKDKGIEFTVHLVPGAKKEAILDVVSLDDEFMLKIAIHAKPTNNQANTGLVEFLSKSFKIAKSNVVIRKGQKSRNKRIFISNFGISDLPSHFIEFMNSLS